jgi:hypothetical protein
LLGRHLCAITHPDFSLDYSPITLTGMSFFEDDRQMNRNPLLLLEFEKLRIDVLGEDELLFEPIYFTMALYSLTPRVKLSEDVHINFNPTDFTSSPLTNNQTVSSVFSSALTGLSGSNLKRILFSLNDEEFINVAIVIKIFKTVSQETNFGTDEYYLTKQVCIFFVCGKKILFFCFCFVFVLIYCYYY